MVYIHECHVSRQLPNPTYLSISPFIVSAKGFRIQGHKRIFHDPILGRVLAL